MQRGEVWWAEFDERRPVVLLSGEDPSGFRAITVVTPADTDISGLGIEATVGAGRRTALRRRAAVRVPRGRDLPRVPGLTTVSREDLTEQAGTVAAAKLREIDDALRASEQRAGVEPVRCGQAQ